MILDKNNLRTVQERTKSYIELMALYVHAKNSNHLRSHLRAIMALYHTDLGQNAVFHNFAIQISLIKYSGRWKHTWAFSEIVKKIFKITYTASRRSLLTTAK